MSALDDRVFEMTADLFRLLAAPTRLRIVCALVEGERSVNELLERVAVSQPNMSQHLGTLYRAGVLSRRRTGAQIFYRIRNEQVQRLCLALKGQHHGTDADFATAGAGRWSSPEPIQP
jgi:DNA-binding transcriptional ArsR family regulator